MELVFRISIDGKIGKVNMNDLSTSPKFRHDLKIGVTLPNGDEDFFYISREKLRDIHMITLKVIENNGPQVV